MNSGYRNVSVSIYGNQRQGINFITLAKPQLKEWFGMPASEDVEKFKQTLLDEILQLWKNSSIALSDQHKKGFERLGLNRERQDRNSNPL